MVKSTSKDAQDLFRSLHSAYSATPTNLKVRTFFIFFWRIGLNIECPSSSFIWQIIDLYVVFAVFTALIQVLFNLFEL